MFASGNNVEVWISSDETVGNLKNLTNQVIDSVEYDPGERGTEQTAAGDGQADETPGIPLRVLTIRFKTNTAADHDWLLLYAQAVRKRAFRVRIITDRGNNKAVNISGVSRVWPQRFTHGAQNRVAASGVQIRGGGGADWVVDDNGAA